MIILSSTELNSVVLADAGEGQVFSRIYAVLGGEKNVPHGRFMVVYHPVMMGERQEKSEHFDNSVDAWAFYRFQVGAELFRAAKQAGLNDDVAELVAQRKLSLADALGEADMDLESASSNCDEEESQDYCDYEEQDYEEFLANSCGHRNLDGSVNYDSMYGIR